MDKASLSDFIRNLQKQFAVIAPVQRRDLILFDELGRSNTPTLEFANSKLPPKAFFFPRSETLFRFSRKSGKMQLTTTHAKSKPAVLIGVRPCDARSLALLDKVFMTDKYTDTQYSRRRANTAVVGVACTDPRTTCFCGSVGGDPFDATGIDLLMTDIDQGYIMEALTQKGEKLLLQAPKTRSPTKEELRKQARIKSGARAAVERELPVKQAEANLETMFDDDFWDRVAAKCLGCGVCTYLCPTCHCFDITDDITDSNGARVRSWDSCMYPLFTLQASGYNPRKSGKERMRQRVMHKFNYTVRNNDVAFCVGCGRCIQDCPVNLDIREVIKAVASQRRAALQPKEAPT